MTQPGLQRQLFGCVFIMETFEVTALKVQKKNPNRVNVYLNGEFGFGVARILAVRLKIGQVLDDEKIEDLKAKDTDETAYQKALVLISYRPRSETELLSRLGEYGYSEEVSNLTVERLKETGLVSDETFARTWVENRSAFRPRSRRLLTLELRQKGVAPEAIQQSLELAGPEDELAYQAAIRYARRLAEMEWSEFQKRLTAFLGRRGFSYSTSAEVVRRVWTEISQNREITHAEDKYDKTRGIL